MICASDGGEIAKQASRRTQLDQCAETQEMARLFMRDRGGEREKPTLRSSNMEILLKRVYS